MLASALVDSTNYADRAAGKAPANQKALMTSAEMTDSGRSLDHAVDSGGSAAVSPTSLPLSSDQAGLVSEIMSTELSLVPSRPPWQGSAAAASTTPLGFIMDVVRELRARGVGLSSVSLHGSACSYALAPESFPSYGDLDIGFQLETPECRVKARQQLALCRTAALAALRSALLKAATLDGDDISTANRAAAAEDDWELGNAFLAKSFITPQNSRSDDSWCVVTMACGDTNGPTGIDLKFVQHIARPFQFTVDSFSIAVAGTDGVVPRLQSLVPLTQKEEKPPTPRKAWTWARAASNGIKKDIPAVEPVFQPLMVTSGHSDLAMALSHLTGKTLVIGSDEGEACTIRGGGLLKYIRYLLKGFSRPDGTDPAKLERYMVNRFMIDYPYVDAAGMPSQVLVLAAHLQTHPADDNSLFLRRLAEVVTAVPATGTAGLLASIQQHQEAYGWVHPAGDCTSKTPDTRRTRRNAKKDLRENNQARQRPNGKKKQKQRRSRTPSPSTVG